MANTKARTIAAVLLAMSLRAGFSQLQPVEPVKTTLCALVKSPQQFNGKIVQVRAAIEGGVLRDKSCSEPNTKNSSTERGAQIALSFGDPASTGTPLCGDWGPPIVLKKDSEFWRMARYAFKFYTSEWGQVCYQCPLYTVIVDATGRFEHVDKTRANHSNTACASFGGHLGFGAYESRLVLESVDRVTADAIDMGAYKSRFPPEVGEPPVIH
jgi:hypothetical protein